MKKLTTEKRQEIETLLRNKPELPNTVIAKKTGVSPPTIAQIRDQLDIPNPRTRLRSNGRVHSMPRNTADFVTLRRQVLSSVEQLSGTSDDCEVLEFMVDVLSVAAESQRL